MNLINEAQGVLEDAKQFLHQINQQDYIKAIPQLSNSTIGQHTRHFIEFFQCLIQQVPQQQINYCSRKRDLTIESCTNTALQVINDIQKELDHINLDQEIHLYTNSDSEQYIKTNVARELHYNIEHTIHHLAILKIGLKIQCPDICVSKTFGVAPSTIKHLQKQLQNN